MAVILPKRFDAIRFLRKDRDCSTFVATDQRLGRNEVVVKVIARGSFTEDLAFVKDVLFWYRGLRHPYLSEVLDAGLTSRRDLFYVRACHAASELFGGSGADSLKTLVAAVSFLRSRGRVHGAIRPSNIFASGGVARLADPWIGQKRPLVEEDIRFTAPEVLTGGAPDCESDLYSLGAVLYRFFSGRDPFEGSDLESLKAKYVWAYPRPLVSVSHVSKTIGEIVSGLIHKDVGQRNPAFEALKEELGVPSTTATRAPSIASGPQVEKTLNFLMGRRKLRIALVEGAIGSGKSRFAEDVQSLAGFWTGDRLAAVCEAASAEPYACLVRRIVSLVDEENLSVGSSSLLRLRRWIEPDAPTIASSEQPDVEHDVVNLIASIGRQVRLIFLIDDVDRGNRRLLRFLEGMVEHASELELAILITSRPGGLPARAIGVFTQFLGDNFQRQTLQLLASAHAEGLSQFLSSDPERRTHAVRKAGGNPSFLEEYCWTLKLSMIPGRVRKTLSAMIARLPKQARRLAQLLSLFESPVSWEVLSRIAETAEPELRQGVGLLEHIGLVDSNHLSIRYPDAVSLLQSRMPKLKRTELHARCFQYLSDVGCEDRTLAHHAFCGALFDTAAALYLRLAREGFEAKNFKTSTYYYDLVTECDSRCQEHSHLEDADRIKLARCQAQLGNRILARGILESLLRRESVNKDPERLSEVYANLALPDVVEDSRHESVRLLRLAIDCLPTDSPLVLQHYRALTFAFLGMGNFEESERALREVEARCNPISGPQQLEDVRAFMLVLQGHLKEAAAGFLASPSLWASSGITKTNAAVCLEHLGNLKSARELQYVGLQESEISGSLLVQTIALGNLGCIESKLGNFRVAEKLFESALKLVRFQQHEGGARTLRPAVTYSDTAAHFIQTGDYSKAAEYLSRVSPASAWEAFFIALTRCELYLALGHLELAKELSRTAADSPLTGEFFDVERLLIDVYLQEASPHLSARLEKALSGCRRLENRYQECRILIALSVVQRSLGCLDRANSAARMARVLANEHAYRPLAARALLLMGLSAESDIDTEFALKKSLSEAADLGLRPLVLESTFQIGSWRLSRGDYSEAREYLSKCVSITARLADGLAPADRKVYLSLPRHCEARNLLSEASAKSRSVPTRLPELLETEGSFFVHLYRLAASITAARDLNSGAAALLEVLREAIDHSLVVALGSVERMTFYSVRARVSDEVRRRVIGFAETSGDRPYITGVGKDTAIWMPILSLALPGGIYVEYLPDRPPLDERDIEFLTVVAAVTGAAFDRICSKNGVNPDSSGTEFCGIVGGSNTIREVRAHIEIAATNVATVLIEGESGTGKELIARAIHERGPRARGPFIAVDCGALPEGLIEAELFGTKKGAYTGAVTDRYGLFEAADHGTIFLDEISNLGLASQAKLLRVLQEREVRRVGSVSGRVVDVRVIAATNCNLERLVREGKFRQDLLYRLKVLHILLPPLRERPSDIPILAATFLERLNSANHARKYFGRGVLEGLVQHGFPGNVRELQNVVERGFYSTSGPIISRIEFSGEQPGRSEPDEEMENWFKDLTEGRENFWAAVHDRYKRRDIPRERVIAIVDMGLRASHGNYKVMASMFQIPKEQYKRFMDFLRRNQCLLDFRPYRRTRESEGRQSGRI